MGHNVHWLLEIDIKDGEQQNFTKLADEMSQATMADEPGAMNYEWFLSADGGHCHIYERYRDSAATMVHLGNFGSKFAERFLGMVTPTRLVVFGDPNQEVRDALAAFGAVHMQQFAGFAR